ncbi:MAG: 16S rRNA (adenine(1518)-N(6)/adenine(1519)-N(6))-dimethyltransferase RsmA [Phototrophicales bacterium]|nr:MAG: 16S rRNA (adenine(1518)-N(6)/adenine(1519)-N(6))-dimethyltransferase RsmA [Phototrophicales bacterium]
MTNPKALLDQYDIQPKKSLGQNFLHDPNTLEKIVTTAELMPDDTVVEIGPGTGALTKVLAQQARHVFSVEIDERMRPILESELSAYSNVYLVFEDILKVDVLKLVGARDFVVVANVPYYITSAILRHLLDAHRRPRRLVLTIQHEVAERIIAQPGNLNLLAISVQFYGQAEIVTRLKPGVFWPRPDVDSAVIRIDTFDAPPVDVPNTDIFFRVVKAGFSQKRKQLKNALSGGLGIKTKLAGELLDSAGIDPTRRAETLTLEEWASLSHAYASQKA